MDMYNFGKFVGVMIGVAVGLLICVVLFRFLRGKGHWEFASKYDERQTAARGFAYQCGFWTGISYLAVWFLLEECGFALLSTPYMLLIGMTLALSVQVSISIWKDAYYGINDDPKKFLITLAIIDLGNAAMLTAELVSGITEHSNFPWLLAATLVMGVTVFVTMGVKMLVNRKEEDE